MEDRSKSFTEQKLEKSWIYPFMVEKEVNKGIESKIKK
jgi:hypothetical protein